MSSTNIYKGVPALNTLNIDVSNMAPDNLTLEAYKAVLKIGEEFDKTQQTANFTEAITKLDMADTVYKNTFLSNKETDFQKADFRESALKGLNETVETKKKIILETKGIDGAYKQKLYQHLAGKSGELALGLHKDILTYETKENIDNTIDSKNKMASLIKNSDISADRTTYYEAYTETMDRMNFFGSGGAKFFQDSIKEFAEAETYGYGQYLKNVLIHSGAYDTIPLKREALNKWLEENTTDESLNKKVDLMTKNSNFSDEEKEYLKTTLKENFEIQYTKANAEIYDLEVDYAAQIRNEKAMLQAANITATALREQIAAEQLISAKEKATNFYTSNNLRGIASMRNGSPATHVDVLRESFLLEATGMDRQKLVNGVNGTKFYVDAFEDNEIRDLINLRNINKANNLNDYDFYKANIERLKKGLTSQEQELIDRELHIKGVIDYNVVKLANGKNEEEKRKIFGMQKVMETGKNTRPNYDMSVLPVNDKLRVLMDNKFGNNPVARSMFINYYSGLNQENQLPGSLRLESGGKFLTSLGVAARRNDSLYNDMASKADYFNRLSQTNNFTKATYNTGIIDKAANNEAGILTDIKTKGKGATEVRAKSQEGLLSKDPKWHGNKGNKEAVPPKPTGAPKNGNQPSTKQGKALGGI